VSKEAVGVQPRNRRDNAMKVLINEPVHYELADIGDGIYVPVPKKKKFNLADAALEVALVLSWLLLGGSVVYALYCIKNHSHVFFN
jgi:hypothetical protein